MKRCLLLLFLLSFKFVFSEGFLPGTLVKTESGYLAIECMQKGDQIISCDDAGKQVIGTVTAVTQLIVDEYGALKINDHVVCAALDQKIYIPENNTWVCAHDLITDQSQLIKEPVVVYALSVEPQHTLYVTRADICVHNFIAPVAIVYPVVSTGVIQLIKAGVACGVCIKLFGDFLTNLKKCGTGLLKWGEQKAIGTCVQHQEPMFRSRCGYSQELFFPEDVCGYQQEINCDGFLDLPDKKVVHVSTCAKNNSVKKPRGFNPKKKAEELAHKKAGQKEARNKIIKADNMRDFLENTDFGRKIASYLVKTKFFHGKSIMYQVTKNIDQYDLAIGDLIYFDTDHKDHIEIFSGQRTFKKVMNLDGTKNEPKSVRAQHRKI